MPGPTVSLPRFILFTLYLFSITRFVAASRDLLCRSMTASVRRVAITGGTHGNESNGLELARHFQRNLSTVQRPSFTTIVKITNPAAVAANVRYVDEDLNRCFLKSSLSDPTRHSTEAALARDLNTALGPKGSASPAVDLVIDLHNTTAATGVALIMSPSDDICLAIAARLTEVDPTVVVSNWAAGAADYALLPSVTPHGMTFEVGPAPWGCIEPALYAQSLTLVHAALDYIETHNAISAGALGPGPWHVRELSLPVFCSTGASVDYPRHADGTLAAMVHPDLQGRDFRLLKRGDAIFQTHDLRTLRFGEMETGAASAAAVDALTEDVYAYFINEAAYYEKGSAFTLGTRSERAVKLAAASSSTADR